MARKTQRVKHLMEDFMSLHNEGMTIPEIAVATQVDPSTIYKLLQEIADRNGVTREELLKVPHTAHTEHVRTCKEVEKVDVQEMQEEFMQLYNLIGSIIKKLDVLERTEY